MLVAELFFIVQGKELSISLSIYLSIYPYSQITAIFLSLTDSNIFHAR